MNFTDLKHFPNFHWHCPLPLQWMSTEKICKKRWRDSEIRSACISYRGPEFDFQIHVVWLTNTVKHNMSSFTVQILNPMQFSENLMIYQNLKIKNKCKQVNKNLKKIREIFSYSPENISSKCNFESYDFLASLTLAYYWD